MFPRAIALSEVAWTDPQRKDLEDFKERLKRHRPYLDAKKVNYRTESGVPALLDSVIVREPLQRTAE